MQQPEISIHPLIGRLLYKGLQSSKNQEKLRNARLCNIDKNTFHLPRQCFPQTLKTLNLSYVLDSKGTFY